MKNILVFTDHLNDAKEDGERIYRELSFRKVCCGYHKTRNEITTTNCKILITSDLYAADRDGVMYDRIFIRTNIPIPDILRFRSKGSIFTSCLIPDICDFICYDDNRSKYIIDTDVASLYPKMMWPVKNPWATNKFTIKKVIFNDPATIVLWSDGSKTVVKCQDDDIYDPEKGLAMAISKKALGNKGNYCNELKKWLPKEETTTILYDNAALRKLTEELGFGKSLKSVVESLHDFSYSLSSKKRNYNPVQRAYDILVGWRDGKVPVCKAVKENMDKIDELIGYLGEALED